MKAENAVKGFLKKGSLQASKLLGMNGLKLKEKSPEILMVVGVVTGGAAIVSAVFAGRKLDMLLSDHEDRVEAAKAEVVVDPECIDQNGEFLPDVDVEKAYITRTKKEINRAVRHEYGVTLIRGFKLFALPGGLFAVSMGSFVAVKNIQGGMINALTGAYTSLQEYCRAYEQRNIELNGEESHRMCKYGYKEVDVEEEDPDNGETYKVKKKVPLTAEEVEKNMQLEDYGFTDHYIVFCKESSPSWDERSSYNVNLIERVRDYIEDLVHVRGWAVLNDVYDCLGMKRTKEGMLQGWVKNRWVKGSVHIVDFGLEEEVNEAALRGKLNQPIILQPNVCCNVYAELKKIEEEERHLAEQIKMTNAASKRVYREPEAEVPFDE